MILYFTDLIQFLLLFTFVSPLFLALQTHRACWTPPWSARSRASSRKIKTCPSRSTYPATRTSRSNLTILCASNQPINQGTSFSLFFLPTDAFEPDRAAAPKGRPREVRLPSSQAGLGPDQVQGLLGRGLQEVLGAHTGGSGHLIWIEKQILAGADPAVPYSSRDDSRRAGLVEPTVDQLLQVKGKSNNLDEDKK